ncbi:hypothetical protein C8R46DRAFT_439354 [Mycena filopes]|nr:hypothetical protein C8R46DRAFT_439354 [Mycena filopes]
MHPWRTGRTLTNPHSSCNLLALGTCRRSHQPVRLSHSRTSFRQTPWPLRIKAAKYSVVSPSTPMDALSVQPLKTGLVNFPGATPESKVLVAELLHKGFVTHHCFYNERNFANHLSHHILSLHDLGAPAEWIQAMYEEEAATQRPQYLNGSSPETANTINETNWQSKLGPTNATKDYPAYLSFFSAEIAKRGVSGALEHYLFSPEANGNGAFMLARFTAGLLHPLIDAGLGVEFGQDFMVAQGKHALQSTIRPTPSALNIDYQGLAQAALTSPIGDCFMDSSSVPEINSGPSTSLLSLLRELYASPTFSPTPTAGERPSYAALEKWVRARPEHGAAIRDIYAKWTFDLADPGDFAQKVEECMWQATLLLGATGKANASSKPQMDFFLMHFLTGSLCLRPLVDAIQKPLYKAQLLQTYARTTALFLVLRGRPRIDVALVMSYPACPVPPHSDSSDSHPALKSGLAASSPWLTVLNNAMRHPEPHVIKAIRALFYCAQQYGDSVPPGAVDEHGEETHPGLKGLDETVFIRVAGKVLDAVGWVAHGDGEQFWSMSGWEET